MASALAGSLGAVGGAAKGVGELISAVGGLLPTSQTTSFSGGTQTQTQQTMFNEVAVQRMLDLMLQSSEGLQATAGGERQAGLFDSTTNQMLINDLLARAAGEVAMRTAPVETKVVASPTKTKVKSKKCFITTAICQHAGKADDCYELETLRTFRDSWLSEQNPMDIVEYYKIAPAIVSGIQARADSADIWNKFNEVYIQPAVVAIEQNRNFTAYNLYHEMFIEAKTLAGV